MRHDDEINRTPNTYQLGPFKVLSLPYHYELYTRYTLLANGVPIRDQISAPEMEDGWQGIAFCKANHLLTDEQLAMIKDFGHPRRHLQRRLK